MRKPKPLARDEAYKRLLDRILSGSLDPQHLFSERELAESLGLSRTPVREALRDLARDGLLGVAPARGTFVRQLSLAEMRELYEVRHALEGFGARLAAERGPTPELLAFAPVLRRDLRNQADAAKSYETGARFHLVVMRAARNGKLLEIYEPLRLRARVALGLPRYFDVERVRESVAEHLGILEAIEARDGALAEARIVAHLARGLEARIRIFSRLKEGTRREALAE